VSAVYNEIDPYACEWLEHLIDAKQIAPGRVYGRSIAALHGVDVSGPGQRHFFAGIGGWSYALRLAGWPDGVSVWTGSCPCQPFSIAGHGGGITDVRHLWPEWFRLIAQCRPAILFGEQVASGPGLAWLDAVFADLEGAGYACAAADLSAASVGAPHIRQRLYFVAYARGVSRRLLAPQREPGGAMPEIVGGGEARGVADSASKRAARDRGRGRARVADSHGAARGMGDPGVDGDRQHARELHGDEAQHAQRPAVGDHASIDAGAARDPWAGCEWVECADGKSRPVEPGTFPLAHGTASRVGQLRAYGNAIVPQLAAAFIVAALDAIGAA